MVPGTGTHAGALADGLLPGGIALPRAIVLVLDSVGIGTAPDSARYGDEGADTVGHIAEACARGDADCEARSGPLHVPNLVALGLGEACRMATGRVPPGLDGNARPVGAHEFAVEQESGCPERGCPERQRS